MELHIPQFLPFLQMDSVDDVVQQCCQQIQQLKLDGITDQQKNDYKKRKLITEVFVFIHTYSQTLLNSKGPETYLNLTRKSRQQFSMEKPIERPDFYCYLKGKFQEFCIKAF